MPTSANCKHNPLFWPKCDCSFLDAGFHLTRWLGKLSVELTVQCYDEMEECGVTQHVMVVFSLEHEHNSSFRGTNRHTDRWVKGWDYTDLSELGSGLLLFHSAVSHEVVEHFAWKKNKEYGDSLYCMHCMYVALSPSSYNTKTCRRHMWI